MSNDTNVIVIGIIPLIRLWCVLFRDDKMCSDLFAFSWLSIVLHNFYRAITLIANTQYMNEWVRGANEEKMKMWITNGETQRDNKKNVKIKRKNRKLNCNKSVYSYFLSFHTIRAGHSASTFCVYNPRSGRTNKLKQGTDSVSHICTFYYFSFDYVPFSHSTYAWSRPSQHWNAHSAHLLFSTNERRERKRREKNSTLHHRPTSLLCNSCNIINNKASGALCHRRSDKKR